LGNARVLLMSIMEQSGMATSTHAPELHKNGQMAIMIRIFVIVVGFILVYSINNYSS
jgi:hypothetical protein